MIPIINFEGLLRKRSFREQEGNQTVERQQSLLLQGTQAHLTTQCDPIGS